MKVVKIPLQQHERPSDARQVFPRMPRLYLELVENKNKIKQELINKEYVAPVQSSKQSGTPPAQTENREYHKPPPDEVFRTPVKDDEISFYETAKGIDDKINAPSNENESNSPRFVFEDNDIQSPVTDKDSGDNEDSQDRQRSYRDEIIRDKPIRRVEDDVMTPPVEEENKNAEVRHLDMNDLHHEDDYKVAPNKSSKSKSSHRSDASDDMTERLNDLLNNDHNYDSDEGGYESKHAKHKYQTRPRQPLPAYNTSKSPSPGNIRLPPSLKELSERGNIEISRELRNVDINPVADDDDDLKRELIFKIDLLRKSFPSGQIPEFNIYSDYSSMKRMYDMTLRKLSLDSSVDNYKSYLSGGFMICEYALGKFLKLDMEGFAQQQISNIGSYDKLLIELGEKSYVPEGSRWPVEVRLVFLILFNAAMFVLGKMFLNHTGANILNMVNGFNATPQQPQALPRVKKMSGPVPL